MFEMKEGYENRFKKNPKGSDSFYIVDAEEKVVAKKCSTCGEVKVLEMYAKESKNKLFGRQATCSACHKIKNRNRFPRMVAVCILEITSEFQIILRKHRLGSTEYKIKTDGTVIEKKCTGCNKHKSLESFTKNKNNKFDGKEPTCKECKKEYRDNNKEIIHEQGKKWREKNKEYKREIDREYRKNNPELIYEGKKRWLENNMAHTIEYKKKHYQDNKLQYRLGGHIRTANEKLLPATLTIEEDVALFESQGGKCFISGKTTNLHGEHFWAISCGSGGSTYENMYYMEGSLNISKNDKNPFEWIKKQPKEYQHNFHNKLVPEQAHKYSMSVEDFTSLTYEVYKKGNTRKKLYKELGFTKEDKITFLKRFEGVTPIEIQIEELKMMVKELVAI